jgi:hypothetical protein
MLRVPGISGLGNAPVPTVRSRQSTTCAAALPPRREPDSAHELEESRQQELKQIAASVAAAGVSALGMLQRLAPPQALGPRSLSCASHASHDTLPALQQ